MRFSIRVPNGALLAVGLVLASLGAAGCGSSATSLCDEICDCEGCSDTERDDCVDDLQDAEKEADDEGCTDQYNALASCVADQIECRDGDIDADGCDKEEDELDQCMD